MSSKTVEIVQNFTLPGDVCRKLAVDWSADNKISVCTDKAVYIMTSYCSPVETGFPYPLHKQIIRAPTKPMNLGSTEIPTDIEEVAKTVEEMDCLYQVLFDHTLTPTVAERFQPFLGFRCAKWSPKGAARAGRCLLATLTMDHRLALYEEKDKDWKCLLDLSELLKTTYPTENFSQELKTYVKESKKDLHMKITHSSTDSDSDSDFVIVEKRGRPKKGTGRGRGSGNVSQELKTNVKESKQDLHMKISYSSTKSESDSKLVEKIVIVEKRGRGRPKKGTGRGRGRGRGRGHSKSKSPAYKKVGKKKTYEDDPCFEVENLKQNSRTEKLNGVASVRRSSRKKTETSFRSTDNEDSAKEEIEDSEQENKDDSQYEDMEVDKIVESVGHEDEAADKPRSGTVSEEEEIEDNSEDKAEDCASFLSFFNCNKMRDEVYRIAAMELTWTGMFGTPATSINDNSYEYCYLIVGMKSGHIQFWKISPNDGKMVSLAYEWNTGLDLLTSICWQQTSPTSGFLMVGSWKGILAFIPINVRIYEPDQEPKLVVKEMCQLWNEEDNVAVDHISVLKTALKKYVIIAAKQHALVACEIILTDASIIIRNVGHSFGLHNLPITGMCVLDSTMPQYRILISTMEGILVEIKVSVGNDEITFQHDKVNIDVDFKHLMSQGLAVSSNGILCALILKTAVYYDHLGIKEPLKFVLFVTQPYEDIYAKLKKLLKPQFSFLPASCNTITKHTDFLECIRINLANNVKLPEWMTSFLDNDPNTYENLSSLELYFIRFLLHSYVSGLAVAAPKDKGNLELKLFTVDAVIMRNYISKVFGSCQDKIDLLTPAQGQSLLLMADWLFKEFKMPVESLYTALGFETPEDPEALPPREICRICKEVVQLDSVKTGQCARNHMFGRCCQSLLLCDVLPYYQCNSCKSVALQDVWNFGLTCTYCGMTMV